MSKVTDVRIDHFTLQLLTTLKAADQIESRVGDVSSSSSNSQLEVQLGSLTAPIAASNARVVELMNGSYESIHARIRVIKDLGSTTHVAVAQIKIRSGRAGSGSHPDRLPSAPIIHIAGGVATDDQLGGVLAYPGPIDDFITARLDELAQARCGGALGGLTGARPPRVALLLVSAMSRPR